MTGIEDKRGTPSLTTSENTGFTAII